MNARAELPEDEPGARPPTSLLIVTGMSGGGKTVALNTFEDLGFYCVDNLPAELLPEFVRAATHPERAEQKLAVGIDMRNRGDLANLPEWLSAVGAMGLEPQLVFFDAADATLLKRYAETRRRHPLTHLGLALADAIALERQAVKPLLALADVVVDTSDLNVHQLRHRVITELGLSQDSSLSLLFESFAYRRGLPADADFVFDARSLPNPHWDPRLKPLSGRDAAVRAYLEARDEVNEYVAQVADFLDTWLPRMQSGTRSYVTVAFGCSGGRHRSVYLAETLAAHARDRGWTEVATFHRELD
ncbi:RNase adapter RapZ [Luteimonas kalidii]|uniref:RNase adapter RapZ n=1 Tax=Luteimonas kalidii TaxID=3042025 RepID=A0ABT6JWQ4_9GAMM|nr:RNase adapter RapZ [Luteimonas kalidii]MDH5834381.1 RNase adapter RapZ [Luteimonas kalidii]